jgi:hypothetical protein
MATGGYPAARTIAPAIRSHFSRHLDVARERGQADLAVLPDVDTIERLIDAAFWASLRHEEGYAPKISLAFLPPEQAEHPIKFERALALAPAHLARVAPAVERPGIHLGAWGQRDELRVWGATRTIPPFCFVLEVAGPGLLVIKHHPGGETGKFFNVAVLEGDEIKLVDQDASSLPDCPALLTSLLGFDSPASWLDSVNMLVELAVSMRAHRRGGLLLVVPPDTSAWRESIVHPIAYDLCPPFCELARLVEQPADQQRQRPWRDAVDRCVDALAGLTAVDGAALLNSTYELLAFGAKIARRKGWPQVEQVMVTEPIEGATATVVHPGQLGGTRHLAAAQFTQDQRDGVALVASQDGRFTVFAWSPCEEMVHAHRVEVLLL